MSITKKTRNKLIILASLLGVLICLAIYSVFFFRTQRLLPMPGVNTMPSYIKAVYEPFGEPVSIAIGGNEVVYLTDAVNRKVHAFDSQGNLVRSFEKLTAKKTLGVPSYIAVNAKGDVYVSDRLLASVFIFDKNGKFKREFLPDGKKDFKWNPLGMTFDSEGNFYVTDVGNHQVWVFNSSEKLLRKFGGMGYAPYANQQKGKFYFPTKIAVSEAGEIYVADGNNNRIQIFDNKGKFIKVLLTMGAVKGFALDEANGKIYVPDVFGHSIVVFNISGKRLQKYGGQGNEIGQLAYPSDVALSKDGTLYISDAGNKRFLVWKKPMEAEEAVKTVWPYLASLIAGIIALIIAFVLGNRLLAKNKKVKA